MYYVMSQDEDANWIVDSRNFVTRLEAVEYKMTIAIGRNPRVVKDMTEVEKYDDI